MTPDDHRSARGFPRGVDHRKCMCGGCQIGELQIEHLRDGTGRFVPVDVPNASDRVYACAGCKRLVPWCFGAADQWPELCDDCWADRDRGTCESCGGPADLDDADRVQCDCGTTVCSACCVAYEGESYCSLECGREMEAWMRRQGIGIGAHAPSSNGEGAR